MDMTEKELMQAVEGMYHNLNTLQSRAEINYHFTSINYGNLYFNLKENGYKT